MLAGRALQAATNAWALARLPWSRTMVVEIWKIPRLPWAVPGRTDGSVVAKTPSPSATRCSLNSAVFDVPSMIDATRTGPELAGPTRR